MGVYGLWDLILATAEKDDLDNLTGKILAIDASIWLVRANSLLASHDEARSVFAIKCISHLTVVLKYSHDCA